MSAEKKFYSLLHPRVATFVCSGNEEKTNVMAATWVTPISENPPTVGVAIWKNTYTSKLIDKYGEFAICVAKKEQEDLIFKVGSVHGSKNYDKFKEFNIKERVAKNLKIKLVDGCAGYLECKLINKVKVGECFFFIGEVLSFYAEEEAIKNWNKIVEFC